MFYLRVVGNEIFGFYDFELFTEEQLDFDFIVIDDELQRYIRKEGLRYFKKNLLIKTLDSSEEKVLTIKDKNLFSKTPQLEK